MEITGVILAGGGSRRMGTDKALLRLGGMPLIAYSAARLSGIADNIVIACGEAEREAYRVFQLPLIPDIYPGLGPLAGLHAALGQSHTEWVAVQACDLPFASKGLFTHMLETISGGAAVQAVVPVTPEGRVQPLLALYHKSILPVLEKSLLQRRLRVMEVLDAIGVHYVREGDYPEGPGTHALSLLNMNTPEDYAAALKLAPALADDSAV
ncbi:molybdenum cofactor guanylyltransferase [Paenibacillus sp. S150]|uniref:molybdenum cofactor guanylyltransferase n=1 Tax=Paenibacillus sp. S150 TaxID=2749826 RepID=UPI001C588D0B|nr:molybdenum cofactor guanylyltransferase [Paenibacillus sp. S150]MBW4082202.1 molybdenum cofactor guanylyltransferase [Paenibacillus sp. S150]